MFTDNEAEQIFNEVIKRSKTDAHFKPELITNIIDFLDLRQEYNLDITLYKQLLKLFKKEYRYFLKAIRYNASDFSLLQLLEDISSASQWYLTEARLIDKSLTEYSYYLRTNTSHLVNALLFKERENKDMIDYLNFSNQFLY